jgi:integrase
MEKLYNQEIKEKFLSTYENEQTQNTIRRVFYKSELIESVLEKDLYAFTLSEIGKTISNANPYSSSVARSLGRFISQYISWALPYRNSNINPLQGVTPDWFDQFVDKTKKIHYNYTEFLELLNEMNNAQDQCVLSLLFEGMNGNSFSELRDLTFEDIDWDNNEIYIKERDQSIVVSSECMKYLDKAYNQETYYTYNPETKEHKEKLLLNSKYVLKNVKSGRTSEGTPVSMAVIYNRLNSLKLELGLEYLTSNAVRQSGIIWECIKIYNRDGHFGDYEQFAEIGEKYSWSKITNNGYTYFNSHLMREFLNSENIKNLYNIDIEF